ncbi:heme-binding domain-containing protein [Seonamhaeicola sp. ML3]|uniref:heme-binding domain-containing protein n=1 Tax=Seonamhaeicola sp. ML3 TaxID=2937786 RepID=UPI00200C91D8|nr:heme-binding domain-containing protein [Seonamhaeicola sp. ML3]
MKLIKKIGLVLIIALVIIQFIRPDKNNAETRNLTAFITDTKPSTEVTAILEKHCYDCHSDKTTYPWYAELAPVSLWIDHHVEEGKEHFNVSNWSKYKLKKRDHKLDELIEEVEEGEMPLESYSWLHGSITEEEKETLIKWANGVRASYNIE